MLLVVAIIGIISVPLTAWVMSTLRQQELSRDVLDNTLSSGKLGRWLSGDVASSAQLFVDTGGDCVGGRGAGGTVRLVTVSGGISPKKVVYAEAASSGVRPGVTSLWRRECGPDGTLAAASEVFRRILAGSVRVSCPTGGPDGDGAAVVAPGGGSSCAENSRRVRLSLLPAKPVATRPVELHATRRTDSTSISLSGGGNRPPVAQISASPLVGSAATEFRFSAAATTDPDGDPLSYEWEFPDGDSTAAKAGRDVTHRFSAVGEHTVLLRVTDGRGGSNVTAATVRVINLYPIALAQVTPGEANLGDEFTFDASASYDPDGPKSGLSYSWDLGEGVGTRTGEIVTVAFPADAPTGRRQVSVKVTDAQGGSDTAFVTFSLGAAGGEITITPTPVIVPLKTPRVGSVGPGLDPLEVSFSAGPTQTATEWVLTRAGSGEPVAPPSGSAVFTHTFGPNDAGEYRIARRRVSDGVAYGAPVEFRVNQAPVADFTFRAAAAGAVSELRGSGSSDSDGQVVSWRWNLGFFDNWLSTNPDPAHVFTDPGTYQVTLEVTDDDGATGTVTKPIVISGTQPVPQPPSWQGGSLSWRPVPGAGSYRIVLTCDSVPFVPDAIVGVAPDPSYTPPDSFCPSSSSAAAARLRVEANGILSLPSDAVSRP
jgi:PKD repeat protein